MTQFTPIVRRALADDVAEQLASEIRSGRFAPGTRIASEETLCREFVVSRTSVREAIRELITLGLVERRGNRPHVVELLPQVRVESTSRQERIRELFETRLAIEVPLTEYAALRATPRQRDEISRLAEQIVQAKTTEQLRPLDRAFHSIIAAAAGNALLAELHTKVLDAVFDSAQFDALLTADHSHRASASILAATSQAHMSIAAAVVSGDAHASGAAARAHLADVEARVNG
jgi:DNA-binding FadR family transcriptional regulator